MANSFSVPTYSPKDVTLTIGGYQVIGWESVSIVRNVDGFYPVRGIRGKNTRVRNLDTSATIVIPLLQTSPSNDVLSNIHEQDLLNGTARISLTLKDRSGRSVFSSDEAYIIGYPEANFAGTFSYRSWRIFCQSTKSYNIAGNTKPGTTIFDSILDEAASFVNNIL